MPKKSVCGKIICTCNLYTTTLNYTNLYKNLRFVNELRHLKNYYITKTNMHYSFGKNILPPTDMIF